MSYCRFSDDDYRSDVYCYQGANGYVTHVASMRVLGDIPHLPTFPANLSGDEASAWVAAHEAQMEYLEYSQKEAISLPHAGKTILNETEIEMQATLWMLKDLGYHIPTRAIWTARPVTDPE